MSGARGYSAPIVLGALVVGGAIAGFLLNAIPLAMAAAALPWLWLVARRFGLDLAVALVLLSLLWVLTITLILTAAFPVSMAVASAVFGVAGVGGIVVAWRTRLLPNHPLQWPPLLAALGGSVLWVAFQLASQVLPPFERLSWLMRNDSLNNLIFARDVLRFDGISLGGLQNPAPLPASLIAIFMKGGRGGVDSASLLEHDLTGMGVAWGTLIVITCLLAGLASSAMARRAGAKPGHQVLASVLGSLAMLSWYATGSAMEYGFINTDVSLPVLFSLILIALSTRLITPVRISALAVGATVMLAVWSPLAVIPVALLALAVVTEHRELLALGRTGKIVVAAAFAQLLAWGLGVTVPTLLSQKDALAGAGGIFRSPWWIVFAVGIVVVILDRIAAQETRKTRGLYLPAVVVAAFTGIGFLLYVSRRAPDIWTYYPVKFSWFVTLLLGVLAIGLLVGVVGTRVTRPLVRRALLTAIAGSVALLVAWAPDITPNLAMNPLDRLVRSQSLERIQQLHEQILGNADPENPVLFWNDLEWWEAEVDLWLISLKADTLLNTPLRLAAYSSYTNRSIEQLCELIGLMGPNLTVITSDPLLPTEVDDNCGDTGNATISLR